MTYIENPKTKNSGIQCVIPHYTGCPLGCEDCFFMEKRSFLEPLEKNLPNMLPILDTINRIIRINDGHDSSLEREMVLRETSKYQMKFYNTSIPITLNEFIDPVVLTINPGKMTDKDFYKLDPIPKNLMFIRIRVNTWNIKKVVVPAVSYYSQKEIPIVLTFLAYFTTNVKKWHKHNYIFRKRTLNSYNAITTKAWEKIMKKFKYNKYVDLCGKIEGEKGDTHCRFCGNCLKHYFACMEKIRK